MSVVVSVTWSHLYPNISDPANNFLVTLMGFNVFVYCYEPFFTLAVLNKTSYLYLS